MYYCTTFFSRSRPAKGTRPILSELSQRVDVSMRWNLVDRCTVRARDLLCIMEVYAYSNRCTQVSFSTVHMHDGKYI
jgi:hypothetical protein